MIEPEAAQRESPAACMTRTTLLAIDAVVHQLQKRILLPKFGLLYKYTRWRCNFWE